MVVGKFGDLNDTTSPWSELCQELVLYNLMVTD